MQDMGATNFLTGIIHAFVSTLYLYTWYWTGFNIWQRFFHRDRRRFVHFVSWWTFLCQTVYFVIVFCCDLIKVVTPPSCTQAYRFLDYFFSGLVLPSAINSFILFWISHLFLRYPAPFYTSLIKPHLFTTITNHNTLSLSASQHNQALNAQSVQTQGSKDASAEGKTAATSSGVKFPVARTVSDTDQPNTETKRPFDISSGSCLNVEHDESKVAPSVSIDIRSAASSEAVGNPNNQASKPYKTGQFLSPTDYNSCRHFSMDSRSEHSEFLTCGVAGSVLNCRSASVGSAMLPKDDASLVLHMRIRPRENTDLSLIIPSHNHSIPTWVLHVTHSAVGLSALLETLLSQPTATLDLIPNILVSTLLPLTYFTFISAKLLFLEPTAKTAKATGNTAGRQKFWTNLSFLAILVAFVVNCAICASAAVASVYLNSWSNFLHTYISMGFESAVVMQ